MGREYRVGVVGVYRGGSLGGQLVVFPRTKVVALCDVDGERLAQAGKEFSVADRFLFTRYEDFLGAPLDVIVVATPIPLHAEHVTRALDSGRHVLSEVTAADTLEGCERIVSAVKRTGRIYMMAENACYFYFIREWKRWIEQGRLGTLFYAEAEYIHELHDLIRDPKTGKTFWRVDRPPIHYISHSLGPLLYLMEDRVVKVTCADAGYGMLPDLGRGCLNMEVALFKTERGRVIKILRSQVAYREPRMHYYSLYGTKGYLENGRGREPRGMLFAADEMGKEEGHRVIECPISEPGAPADRLRGGHGTTEYFLIRDFVNALDQGAKPPIDVVRAMDFTVPGIIADESAKKDGLWLDVPQFSW
jgi:predicted dehydrogenase